MAQQSVIVVRDPFSRRSSLFQLDGQNGRKKRTAESPRRMASDESCWRAVVQAANRPGHLSPLRLLSHAAVTFFVVCFGPPWYLTETEVTTAAAGHPR